VGERGDYDVAIIGLGPAGAAAAVELARGGARVVALDRPKARAKPCGGCVSARAAQVMEFMDLPPWVLAHPVERLILAAPGRLPVHSLPGETGAYLVDRGRLDALLRRRAGEAGAEVVAEGAKAARREGSRWRVSAAKGDFTADWLIGADGAGGLLGRGLGLGRTTFHYRALVEERPLPPGLAAELSGTALLELGAAPLGYAWAFARGDGLNLGLAGRGGLSTAQLVQAHAAFLRRRGLGPPGAWRGALIPCPGWPWPRLVSGRAAVVGDAAALADPFLGEGIGQAVMSGRLAARAVKAGDLMLYAHEIQRTLLTEHAHARALAALISRAPKVFQGLTFRHPGALRLVWQVLRGERGFAGIWGGVAAMALGRPAGGTRWGLDRDLQGLYSKHLM
jgi:geranylgeranyl reductase family protein